MRAVIIGSGFGGLAIGLRLLAKGYEVMIIESREKVGGRAYQLKLGGYTFDMGPSLITAPGLFDELFCLFGKKREDYLEFVRLDPYYRIYFEKKSGDGFQVIDYNGDPEHMRGEMEKLEPGGGKAYDAFFEATRPIYDLAYKKYGRLPFLTLKSFIKILPEMLKVGAVLPMTCFAKRFFRSDFGMRTFSFHPLYIGTNPYNAPAALGFIPWLEREEGVWFAKGGMYCVVDALRRLFLENGGVIHCEERVHRLEVLRDNPRVISKVITDVDEYEVDLVVSNADVLGTYNMLSENSGAVRRKIRSVQNKSYSMSLLLLYFGLNRQYHDKLAHHTLILGKEYKGLLEEVFNEKVLPTTLSMYLHIPSVTDSSMAPEKCESMYILIPLPNLSGSLIWDDNVEKKIRDFAVDYLENTFGLEGFSKSIVEERRMNPNDFMFQLNSTYGAAFSTQLSLLQSVYFRAHNRSDEIDNLFFVGAGTHPGPGVPGVLMTAACTDSLIPAVK